MDEPVLMNRLDSQAVAGVFDRYYPDLFRFVRYRMADESLAEDIASEVFVRLLEAVEARRGPSQNLRGWLFSTAGHLVSDHLRGRYRHLVEDLNETIPSTLIAPGEAVEQSEEKVLVERGLMALTEEQQNVLALRFGAGYSLEETSVAMQKNVNTIKQLQYRALASLQRKIGESL